MSKEHGNLSINSQNIFPIIKKWMYSDHDIFYRELVSNACDAITKLKKLSMIGEYEAPDDIDYKVEIKLSANDKTIKIIDNGIGMTKEEVDEYINQIAFSGAEAFLEKYKDKANDDQIIGHFGLGFYSAFMVADRVTIDTLSFKDGAESVHWSCDGGTEYDINEGTKTTPGTEITLYLNEDSYEFANEYKAKEVLDKYCSFMPTEIFLSVEGAEQEFETIPEDQVKDDDVVVEHIHEDAKTEEKENEDGTKETIEVSPAKDLVKINKRPVSLSDTHPLWNKRPNECTDEEYKEFYDTHRVIAFSSRFVDQKCQWDMLKSFELLKKDIPDAGLIFLGCRGEYENAVREMAKKSEYSGDIVFAGFQKNVFKFVSRADVFAMTSYYEGFPNVIVEALAVGTPAVSTDCTSGPAEVLAPGRPFLPHCDKMTKVDCGILCPVMSESPDFDYGNINDAHREYAKALKTLLTDDELRARLSANGKKRADELSAENMKQVYFDLTDN